MRLLLESRGIFCSASTAANFSSGAAVGELIVAFSAARFLAYFAVSAMRLSSRLIMLRLAMVRPLFAEREAEGFQQCLALRVRLRRGGDVHAADRIDLVEVDLGENDLLGDAEVEVAAAVEAARRDAAEVADARQRDRDQALEELVHALAAQRDLHADRVVLAHLEVR